MLKKVLIVPLVGLLIVGCAQNSVNLSPVNKTKLQNQSLALNVMHKDMKKPFISNNAGDSAAIAIGGVLGYLITSAIRNSADYGNMTPSPSEITANSIYPAVLARYNMRSSNSANAKYKLEVDTTNWSLYSNASDEHYELGLSQIVAIKEGGNTIMKMVCKYGGKESGIEPAVHSKKEWKANSGALIKLETQKALSYCEQYFKNELNK